jgi:hypothetical protein
MDSGSINAPDLCSSLRSQLFVSDWNFFKIWLSRRTNH